MGNHGVLRFALVALTAGCIPTPFFGSTSQSPEGRLERIRWALHAYQEAKGSFPASIADLCSSRSACDHLPATGVEDVWGTDYQYRRIQDEYELISAGPDRIHGTSDDNRFSSAVERRRVAVFSGCYELVLHARDASRPVTLLLDTIPQRHTRFRARLDLAESSPLWRPIGDDSLEVSWTRGVAVERIKLGRSGAGLEGSWRRGSEYGNRPEIRVSAHQRPGANGTVGCNTGTSSKRSEHGELREARGFEAIDSSVGRFGG